MDRAALKLFAARGRHYTVDAVFKACEALLVVVQVQFQLQSAHVVILGVALLLRPCRQDC